MTRTIVVLGAGIGAAPLIRQIMRNSVLPSKDLKMVVVSPNTHFHWPIAMPRVVVPGQMADEKAMYALEPTFSGYPTTKFEHVLASASSLNPTAREVTVTLNSNRGSRSIMYDTLIIATGASSKDSMPWKVVGTTEETKDRLHQLQQQIESAATIVVAGGGMTGVETVGELGFEYSKSGKKNVYLIHNDALPLSPALLTSVRKQAVTELRKMKVNVIANTTVTSTTVSGKDTILHLRNSDGKTTTIKTQAYLPATGVAPNTSFAPPSMLDNGGFIKQTSTLQAEGFPDIFVVGDAGSLEACKAQNAESQAVHLIKALPVYLKSGEAPVYQLNTKEISGITLGRSRATGQMGSFKVFSLLIWYIKGRFLGTDSAGLMAAGKRTMMTTFEK